MPIDYSKYPPNWKTEIRPRILARANYRCEFCGAVNGDTKCRKVASETKCFKVVLTIAHLDHDEGNHDVKDERLAALCQLCHLRYDAKEKARRRKEKTADPKQLSIDTEQ